MGILPDVCDNCLQSVQAHTNVTKIRGKCFPVSTVPPICSLAWLRRKAQVEWSSLSAGCIAKTW